MNSTRHVSVPVATVGAILISVCATLAAYYGTVNSQTRAVTDVGTRVSVLESKQTTDETNITLMNQNVQFIHDQIIRISTKLGIPSNDPPTHP